VDDNQPSDALKSSMHVSTSNLMSYSLVTMATMLAFYFAFQGGLLAGYSFLYGSIVDVQYKGLAIGKVLSSILIAVILIFNFWSYKIVRVFIDYFYTLVVTGSNIEMASGVSEDRGLYRAMLATYDRPGGHGRLFQWTRLFFVANSAFWVALGIWPWLK
jgi:hypothetical protein